jgi:hypothetical protein
VNYFVAFIFILVLTGISHRADAQVTGCLKGSATEAAAASRGEFPPSYFEKRKTPDSKFFYYVNRTLAPDVCYEPLTLEEKVAQQAGKSERNLVGFQLTGYRHSRLNRWIENSRFSGILSKSALNALLVPVGHVNPPLSVAEAALISKRSYDLHIKLFPGKTYNDESDAFKHYYGAFMFTKLSGPTYARFVMAIHEWDDVTMASVMDRFNNLVAIKDAMIALGENPRITEAQIIERALRLIKDKKLVILQSSEDRTYDYRRDRLNFVSWAHRLLRKRLL